MRGLVNDERPARSSRSCGRSRGRRFGCPVVLLVVPLLASACLPAARSPAPLACPEPCGTVVDVTPPDHVQAEVKVAAGTRLDNARLTGAAEPGCQNGVAVIGVEVDGHRYEEGPATLAGRTRLGLRFPLGSDADQPSSGLSAPVSLDLELRAASGVTCLRLPVPSAHWYERLGANLADREAAR
jgi:hypothetical protein